MKGREKSETELLRARMERRMMTELMEEEGNSEEEILRRQLRRLKGQDILDLRDIHDQKIQQLRIRWDLRIIQIILLDQTNDKEFKMPWRQNKHETAGSWLELSRNSQTLTIKGGCESNSEQSRMDDPDWGIKNTWIVFSQSQCLSWKLKLHDLEYHQAGKSPRKGTQKVETRTYTTNISWSLTCILLEESVCWYDGSAALVTLDYGDWALAWTRSEWVQMVGSDCCRFWSKP